MPSHFVALVRLLIDEERAHGATFQGPCMEHFLKERMFETLCSLGVKDIPAGIRKLMMTIVTDFLTELQQGVLQHNSIHKGVMALTIACQKCADTERSALMDLIGVTLQRLAQRPQLCGFFFGTDAHQMASTAPVFMPIHVLLPLLATVRGSVARRASTALCTALAMRDSGVDSYVESRSNLVELLVAQVAQSYELALSRGTQARRHAAVAAPTNDTTGGYDALARDAADALRTAFAICVDVVDTQHPIADALVEALQDKVFILLVGPTLMKSDEHLASVAALLTCDLLDIARGRVLGALIELIIGSFSDDDANAPDSLLWATVCKRINATAEATGRASLHLVTSLLSAPRSLILDGVVRRRLLARTHIATGSTARLSLTADGQAVITAFLQLFPGQQYGSDTEYTEYLADARARIRTVRVGAPPRPVPDVVRSAVAEPDASSNSAAQRLATPRGTRFSAGALVDALLEALANCTRHSYTYNLSLTAAIAALAHYDDPLLNDFLLNPAAQLQPGVLSLYATLLKLSSDAERRFAAAPHLQTRLAAARKDLNGSVSGTAEEMEEQTFLRAVVVLVEFCKELASIVQIKVCEPVSQ